MSTFIELPITDKSLARRRLVCGVGKNDANYLVLPTVNGKQDICPYYFTWVGMLKRCYESKYLEKHPTYKNCFVCTDWLLFSTFKMWMQKQNWKGKQLDKDLLVPGNKCYSPDTCLFVTQAVNSLMTGHDAARGKYSIGVCWNKRDNNYKAQCSVNGKVKNLGCYLTEEEASKCYRAFKKELVLVIANRQDDVKVKNALIKIAKNI